MILNLPHDTAMLHLAVDGLAHNLCAHERYLDRIKASVDLGVAVKVSDPEAQSLFADEQVLRAMADQVAQCRARLIDNGMPRLRLVG